MYAHVIHGGSIFHHQWSASQSCTNIHSDPTLEFSRLPLHAYRYDSYYRGL